MMIMAKKEYIEREAVRNELYDSDAITMFGVATLNNFPAADVVEVRHAHWIEDDREATCSGCKCRTFDWAAWSFDYCPFCGAKMDGKDYPKDRRIVNPLTRKYSLRRRPPLTKEQLEQMRVEIDANNQNRGAKMDGKGEGE